MEFWRVMNALTLLKAKHPYLRVGQLLANAAGASLKYVSDEDLASSLEALVANKPSHP